MENKKDTEMLMILVDQYISGREAQKAFYAYCGVGASMDDEVLLETFHDELRGFILEHPEHAHNVWL